jgi:hypothetical protein
METETTVVEQEKHQEGTDTLATVILMIVSVFSPFVGLAVGAALRLTGSEESKRLGTTCMIIGGILSALRILFMMFFMFLYFIMIIGIIAATNGSH